MPPPRATAAGTSRQVSTSLRKLPRQRRAQLTFDAILDAAAELLIARGDHRMNTNAVAERAGVSIGSLYPYFPNKPALVDARRARHGARVQRTMTEAFAAGRALPLEDGVRRNLAANLQVHRAERALHDALTKAAAAVPALRSDEPRASVVGAIARQLEEHGLGGRGRRRFGPVARASRPRGAHLCWPLGRRPDDHPGLSRRLPACHLGLSLA